MLSTASYAFAPASTYVEPTETVTGFTPLRIIVGGVLLVAPPPPPVEGGVTTVAAFMVIVYVAVNPPTVMVNVWLATEAPELNPEMFTFVIACVEVELSEYVPVTTKPVISSASPTV